ncbi:MAG: ATP-dependent Clp protease adapter ClpS [Pseudomonadota bacterium]|jgi:ATP-dependent Clp protease adaptor protein ClpS
MSGERRPTGPDPQSDFDNDLMTLPDQKLARPPLYKVVLNNDDYTPMEFVIHVLQKFFRKSEPEAVQIMLLVHKTGKGVAGVFPFSIAETKVRQVNDFSKQHGFPLLTTLEQE